MNFFHNLFIVPWRWYTASWWQPLLSLCVLSLLSVGCSLLALFLNNGAIFNKIAVISLPLFLLLMLSGFIAGIVQFRRRRWGRGILVWLETVLGFIVMIVVMGLLTFVSAFKGEDHFADNLKLPEDIPLVEPLRGGYQPSANSSNDSFQKQLLASQGSGPELAPDAICRIPALEKLMSTPDGRDKLKNYLDANPEWSVQYTEGRGTYATRNIRRDDGSIDSSNFHSNPSGEHGQFFFYISLDGKPWRRRNKTDSGCEMTSDGGAWTWFKAGDAQVTIFDQSSHPGRQMTAKMLELAENEFTELKLPPDTITRSEKPEIRLYDGMQGGMYIMDIKCNPGEPGLLSLRANEVTTGAKLSEHRLSLNTARIFGSEKPDELYHAQISFSIYEGNWGQYYGAHFELWFKPDSGKPDRKIFEEDYKIQGWMR